MTSHFLLESKGSDSRLKSVHMGIFPQQCCFPSFGPLGSWVQHPCSPMLFHSLLCQCLQGDKGWAQKQLAIPTWWNRWTLVWSSMEVLVFMLWMVEGASYTRFHQCFPWGGLLSFPAASCCALINSFCFLKRINILSFLTWNQDLLFWLLWLQFQTRNTEDLNVQVQRKSHISPQTLGGVGRTKCSTFFVFM